MNLLTAIGTLLRRLSSRDRRALFAGVLLSAPVALYLRVLEPYLVTLRTLHEQVEVERDALRRELTLLAEADGYPARLARLEIDLRKAAPRLFQGVDELAATAALTRHVGETAVWHRVVLQQLEAEAAEEAGDGIRRVGLSVRGISDLQGVLGLLTALEGGARLVRVDGLRLERVGAGADLGGQEVLSFAATIRGFAAVPQSASEAIESRELAAATHARTADGVIAPEVR